MDLLQSVDPTSTSSSSTDPVLPSFFELYAQDQLRDLLNPAIRYVLVVFAQRYPRYLLRIVNRYDEVWMVCMGLVERHYLRTWGSSFAENFYGLRRRRRPGISTDRARAASSSSAGGTRAGIASIEALRRREIYLSLFFLVGFPYLQAKAKDHWERIGGGAPDDEDGGADGGLFGGDEEENGGGATAADATANTERRMRFRDEEEGRATRLERTRNLFRACFKKGYPYASAGYHLWLLLYNVSYLFEKTPYWRPWLHAMRVDVRRVGAEDYPQSPPLLPPNMPNALRQPLKFSLALFKRSPYIFFEFLKYALPASIFFFKFIEWWYSADNPRRRRGGGSGGAGSLSGGAGGDGLPMFGPPKVLMPSQKGVLFKRLAAWVDPKVPSSLADESEKAQTPRSQPTLLHNSCPLCGATPVNNPALVPTGYVLCYTCAHDYVRQHGRCPVTLRPIRGGSSEIRRVLA